MTGNNDNAPDSTSENTVAPDNTDGQDEALKKAKVTTPDRDYNDLTCKLITSFDNIGLMRSLDIYPDGYLDEIEILFSDKEFVFFPLMIKKLDFIKVFKHKSPTKNGKDILEICIVEFELTYLTVDVSKHIIYLMAAFGYFYTRDYDIKLNFTIIYGPKTQKSEAHNFSQPVFTFTPNRIYLSETDKETFLPQIEEKIREGHWPEVSPLDLLRLVFLAQNYKDSGIELIKQCLTLVKEYVEHFGLSEWRFNILDLFGRIYGLTKQQIALLGGNIMPSAFQMLIDDYFQEGKLENSLRVARKLAEEGMPPEKIIDILGVSEQEYDDIQKKLKESNQ
jgi:hypothetical protein